MFIGLAPSVVTASISTATTGFKIPTANLAASYVASIGVTVATGVSSWADQSGNLRHLLQGTPTAQPTYTTDVTGKPCILFNGTSHFLKTAPFTLSQPETVYIVFSQLTYTSGDYIFDGNTVNSGALLQSGVSPNLQQYAGAFGGSSTALPLNTVGVVATVFNGAASSVKVNGNIPVIGTAGTVGLGGFTLGAPGSTTSQWANIQVYEVLIYSVAHDDLTQANIITALMGKYNVA